MGITTEHLREIWTVYNKGTLTMKINEEKQSFLKDISIQFQTFAECSAKYIFLCLP